MIWNIPNSSKIPNHSNVSIHWNISKEIGIFQIIGIFPIIRNIPNYSEYSDNCEYSELLEIFRIIRKIQNNSKYSEQFGFFRINQKILILLMMRSFLMNRISEFEFDFENVNFLRRFYSLREQDVICEYGYIVNFLAKIRYVHIANSFYQEFSTDLRLFLGVIRSGFKEW